MRLVPSLILPVVMLAACSSEENAAAAASYDCGALQPLFESRTDAVPFEAVRTGNLMLGDTKLDDQYTTDVRVQDNRCTASVMKGFFGADANIYIVNCVAFQAGSLDNEANEAKAREIFNEVEAMVSSCLGSELVAETVEESADFDIYRKTTWDLENPPELETGSFRVDPVYLEMSYSPFMRGRGGPSGWLVELQLQEQREGE
ncbi:hypothetical protein FF098_009575 [Parvularcula flava]|uniref:DUF3298 domain-containing protein n=1 Tax=Aquisalinus luteolus TaxID=1566827 RepID=A0A8J3ER73_9PROT|nr:hypothetical protein [Aquisalinus luteolus]NHK28151.1 hypothetical protein [Aquisalinus luteolus]GGH97616.1 hypothetical protein GCM10011355_19270 [Aquisalinus luteolus]